MTQVRKYKKRNQPEQHHNTAPLSIKTEFQVASAIIGNYDKAAKATEATTALKHHHGT
jgi:hypothetical protein